jgi:hypothetical protein
MVTLTKAQSDISDRYNAAYNKILENVVNPEYGLFKKSVFCVEDAYSPQNFNEDTYNKHLNLLTTLVRGWISSNPGNSYKFPDSANFHKNYAIYKLLKDTIKILTSDKQEFHTIPYSYDFTDFSGRKDWSNMFVSKLLATGKGNCHSLPYLYKILADELGATCWLSLAPNHVYIKNRSKGAGWYNTELTSGTFPVDAWISASGYIPLEAIQNGIYMDTLSNQQAIALCILDLAKGYEFQSHNYEDGFILKCCDLVLKYHPVNVQALLLKAETIKRLYEKQRDANDPVASQTYKEIEALYIRLFELGYREMPEEMYLKWLKSVTQYANGSLISPGRKK